MAPGLVGSESILLGVSMRTGLSLILFSTMIACSPGADPGGGDDQPPGVDAPTIDPPEHGFQIKTAGIPMIQPGEEVTYCFYFRTPNTESLAIKRFVSKMSPGSHHLIMYTTNTERQPAGTVTRGGCGAAAAGASNLPNWVYAAQTPEADLQLPTDDGAGNPLAIEIAPNTPAYFEMHYLNATDAPIDVEITLNAEALAPGAAFTKTAAYITFKGDISIPPNTANYAAPANTCATPAGAKFWMMSTHAHKQAIKTEVRDGNSMVFESDDWEHPGVKAWMDSPFFAFSNNQLTYQCTYNNPTNRTISTGDSAETDEMCMATGYYFPATKAIICFNSFVVPF